jgi:hypothetical protein
MRAALVVLVVVAAGCHAPYKADLEGKPTARLRMVSTSGYYAAAGLLDKDCSPAINGGWTIAMREMATLPARGREPKRESIGMPMANLPEYASFTEHRIAAGAPITIAYRGTLGNAYCNIALRLTPQEGADYETLFAEEAGGRAGICTIAVWRLRPAGDGKAVRMPAENVQRLRPC